MTVALRPYQVAAATAAWHALTAGQNPIVVMATGTGKSPTFACVARWWVDSCSSDVAVVAHRQELLDQARRHLREAGVPDHRAHVMSVQSLYSEDARPPEGVGLVIYDEAHHAPAPCNLRALAKFDDALVMGLTATPDRSDGKGLGRVFHTVAYRYDAEQAIRDGYLAPPNRVLASSVRELMLLAGRRRTIVFADTVENSKAMAAALGSSAAHVDGKTPSRERARILTAFASGAIQYLCNCDLVTEGFDCPEVEVAAVFRNIGSRGLLAQMVGRAMRPMPGKRECLLVQLPTARELGLVPPQEVLSDSRTVRERRPSRDTGRRSARHQSREVMPVESMHPSVLGRFWKWVWG